MTSSKCSAVRRDLTSAGQVHKGFWVLQLSVPDVYVLLWALPDGQALHA